MRQQQQYLIQMQLKDLTCQLNQLINEYLSISRTTSSNAHITAASINLTAFTKEKDFLDAAFQLIQDGQEDKDRDMLLTSLIKDKFKYDYQTLDRNSMQSYYTNLCQTACLSRLANTIALKNTCLALAYVYINHTSQEPLPIFRFLEPLRQAQWNSFHPYFGVLQYIASELDNTRLVLDKVSRDEARRRAREQQEEVLELLNEKGKELEGDASCLLECFACWVDLYDTSSILNSLPNHSLTSALFTSLLSSDEDVSSSASECILMLISLISNPQKHAPIIAYLGINIVPLITHIQRCLRRRDTEQATVFLNIVLEFSKKAIHLFSRPSPEAMNFLQQLAVFTRAPDLENFKEFAEFWEAFMEEVVRMESLPDSFPDQQPMPNLEPLLLELYDSLCDRCRYSPSIVRKLEVRSESGVADEDHATEMTYKQREACVPLFSLLATLLSHEQYINNACMKIHGLSNNETNLWGNLQSLLFSLLQPLKKLPSIGESVRILINTYGDGDFGEKAPIVVRRTFLKLFRALMTVQQKDDLFIRQLFYYTSMCFGERMLQDQADKTFCRGCQQNGTTLACDLPNFISLMGSYLHREHIIRGVLAIICSDNNAVSQYLLMVMQMMREGVQDTRCERHVRKQRMEALISACKYLKDLKKTQQHLGVLKEFVRQSMPFLKGLLSATSATTQDENPEVQRAVKLVKNLMRTLKRDFWEFVPSLCECAMESFKCFPICSYVYLIEVTVTVFGKEPACEPFLLDLYSTFCEISVIHLREPERYSLLLDDFVGMNKRFFACNAALVLKSNQLPILLDQCLQYVSSDTPRITKATFSFFETIFMAYWPSRLIQLHNSQPDVDAFRFAPQDYPLYQQLKESLRDKVHYIIAKMLVKLSEIPAESLRNGIYDALMGELKAFPEWNVEIWQQLINPLPSDILLGRQKEEFMALLNQTNQKNDLVVQKAHESLQKLIILIYKRMSTASKRQYYHID